jgi:rhodanese-related sulfurtransferase
MFFSKTHSISPADAAAGMARGQLLLVDVREPAELLGGRVDGAHNIPLGQLGDRLGELEGRGPVAFICRSGARSAQATRAAARAGIDAANVSGGVAGWARAGLPLNA